MKRLKIFCGLQCGNLCELNRVTVVDNNTLENVENPSKQLPAIMCTVKVSDLQGHILAISNV